MKVLVTGSAGFIGTNLMGLLGGSGIGLDLKTGQDARRRSTVARAIRGADAVVHLAAVTGVEASVQRPIGSLDNVASTVAVLEAARRVGAMVVLASTAGALSGHPRSPYAASKLAGEGYCHAYAAAFGLRTAVVRFANVYGPHAGEKQSAIPALIRAALAGQPFDLYGDGSQVRDFVYVADICRGIMAVLERGTTGILNLASGRQVSLNHVIGLVGRIAGRPVQVVRREGRVGEAVPHHIDRWEGASPPTELADGLAQTIDWFRSTWTGQTAR